MSARVLTAYLITIGLLAGIISQALAKPPDLPAKVQINCEKASDKMVLKTYQVADLVIPPVPVGTYPDVILPNLAPLVPPPVPYMAALPEPMSATPVVVPPPVFSGGVPLPPRVGYVSSQPYGPVALPVPQPGLVYTSPMPAMPPVAIFQKADACPSPKPCCPACANGKCNGCPTDSCCQGPECVAQGYCVPPQVQAPRKTLEDQLIRLIVSTIKPESWDANGGPGTIDYFPQGMTLIINQTPHVQEQIANLLAALHHLQDEEISVEVRVISVPQGFGEKVACKATTCGEKCGSCCKDKVTTGEAESRADEETSCLECCPHHTHASKNQAKRTYLSDAQVQKFMDCLQANPKTNVMMAPKVTVFNGQPATVNINDQHFFVTNVKFATQGGQPIFIPENYPFETGFRFSVKPMVSADHRFIQMSMEVEERSLDSASEHVPLFPVTSYITPLFEGGAKGEPVPFTMFLQQPAISIQRVHQEVCVPCGQSFLFKAWVRSNQVSEESATPVLSSLPYIGDMFKNVTYHQETADVWVIVTPRLIVSQEQEKQVSPPVAAAPASVSDNLQKLTQARKLMKQADFYRRVGQAGPAQYYYEMVQLLCPGSRYDQVAEQRLTDLRDKQAARAPEPVRPAPCPMPVSEYMKLENTPEFKRDQEVSDYLSQYWRACAEGRMSEAVQWAVQALALDPACFTKARDAKWHKDLGKTVMPSAN